MLFVLLMCTDKEVLSSSFFNVAQTTIEYANINTVNKLIFLVMSKEFNDLVLQIYYFKLNFENFRLE